MKTSFDIASLLYGILNNDAVTSVITGGVYKDERPLYTSEDEFMEDIVVGSLPINFGSIQQAIANVNIYVKDLALVIGGKTQYQPDSSRLKQLTDLVIPYVQSYYSGDTSITLVNHANLKEVDRNEHYSNLRLEVIIHN